MERSNPGTQSPFSWSLITWITLAFIVLLIPVINAIAIPLWIGILGAILLSGLGIGANLSKRRPVDRRSESQSLSEGPRDPEGTILRLNPQTRTPERVDPGHNRHTG